MTKRRGHDEKPSSPTPKCLNTDGKRLQEEDMMAESDQEHSVGTMATPNIIREDDIMEDEIIEDDIMEDEIMEDDSDDDDMTEDTGLPPVFRFGQDTVAEGEELTFDPSAYDVFHQFYLAESCLSMDIVPDEYGLVRGQEPHQFKIVAGTQAQDSKNNSIIAAKCYNVARNWADDSEDEDNQATTKPLSEGKLDYSHLKSPSPINTMKVSPHMAALCAAWCEDGNVVVHRLESHLGILDNPGMIVANPRQKPIFSSQHHSAEGFALTWNKGIVGQLVTGSRDHTICILDPIQGGWAPGRHLDYHQGSVETLCFQTDDSNIFASGSTDKSIALWDLRDLSSPKSVLDNAHDGDVNVVSFRPMENTNHILSGGDDGQIILRDIRMWNMPLFKQSFHKQPVNCLDWHPVDNSMFLATSYDDSVSIWSLDIEGDLDGTDAPAGAAHYPSQLMFLHLGQKHISCAKWHPQIPGLIISTAESGFNVFRPENLVNNN